LRTLAIPEHLRGVFTTRRFTNPRLPYLTFLWSLYRFKNLRELFDGYKHKILMEYVETGVLEGELGDEGDARPELNVICQLIVNNVLSDDCGEVECRAFNKGGMDSTRAQLLMRSTSTSQPSCCCSQLCPVYDCIELR